MRALVPEQELPDTPQYLRERSLMNFGGQNLNNLIYNPRSRRSVLQDMGGDVINCVSHHVTTTMVIEFVKIVLKSLCQQVL